MKAKYTIALLVFGYCLDFFGAWIKITHNPHADIIFTIAVSIKVVGALLFLYKLTNYPKIKEFMNS